MPVRQFEVWSLERKPYSYRPVDAAATDYLWDHRITSYLSLVNEFFVAGKRGGRCVQHTGAPGYHRITLRALIVSFTTPCCLVLSV